MDRGDFQTRHTRYAAAIQSFQELIANTPKTQTPTLTFERLKLGAAHWALRDSSNALEQAMESLNLLKISEGVAPRAQPLAASAVLMAFTLSELGGAGADDKVKIQSTLRQVKGNLPTEHFEEYDIALAVLDQKLAIDEALSQVRAILKVAPNLDWAEWDAVYLGYAFPNQAKTILAWLPDQSIQRTILAQAIKN